MGQYTTKGLYNGYDKNHKERDKTDYYATPTDEVVNILKTLNQVSFIALVEKNIVMDGMV